MTLFNRLKYPQTEADWSLGRNVPGFARRLAILSLRGLLGHITYGPIWTGQPAEFSDLANPDRPIHWPVAHTMAQIFQKALPTTYEILGWGSKTPLTTISYKEALTIVSLGFRELFATQPDNRNK